MEKFDELDFEGADVLHPKYQCVDCGNVIHEDWIDRTNKCGACNSDDSLVKPPLDRIYAVTFSAKQSTQPLHDEIIEAKDSLNHIDKMAKVLAWGIDYYDIDVDAIVPPPRGDPEAEDNHMEEIGKRLSELVDVPLLDVLEKLEDYDSQKNMDSKEERIENVKNKIGANNVPEDVNSAVIIDDVATTGATLLNSARALSSEGVLDCKGLVIARNDTLEWLEKKGYLKEVDDEN